MFCDGRCLVVDELNCGGRSPFNASLCLFGFSFVDGEMLFNKPEKQDIEET